VKSYLCIEDSKEVVGVKMPDDSKSRDALYFVVKAKNWKSAMKNAKNLGAKAVRVLTDSEEATEDKDGLYDIKL
jgi:hypothetical protein